MRNHKVFDAVISLLIKKCSYACSNVLMRMMEARNTDIGYYMVWSKVFSLNFASNKYPFGSFSCDLRLATRVLNSFNTKYKYKYDTKVVCETD